MATQEEDESGLSPDERAAARRERRDRDRDQQEKVQFVKDVEELEKLEDEHGRIGAAKLAFIPGYPTRVGFKMPSGPQYARYTDQVGKAVQNKQTIRAAQETLAKSVWIYPREQEERDRVLERYPGVLTTIAYAAARLAEGKSEDEGKDV